MIIRCVPFVSTAGRDLLAVGGGWKWVELLGAALQNHWFGGGGVYMDEIRLEARDYLNHLKSGGQILHLARFKGSECVGRGYALILTEEDRVAVMLEDCGDPMDTGIRAGDLVNYVTHPEAESKAVGSPASIRP
jgi:hypothetical protein